VILDFYKPGTSFLHRFDVRAKLLLLLPVTASFFVPAPPAAGGVLVLLLAAAVAAAFGLRELAVPLKPILPVLVLVCLLTPPFTRGGRVLVELAGFPLVTTAGLQSTLSIVVRFTGITLGFFAVFRSVEVNELVAGLRWFGFPFSLCLLVIVAFRTIPSLGQTFRNVQDAHRLRGGPVLLDAERPTGRARGRARLAASLPVLTSVLIQAVKAIPVLAMVLESRGFGRENPRTSCVQLKRSGALAVDFLIAAAAAAAFLAIALVPWP
jgi:energy-coupling factor transport system permease protein